LPVLLLYIPATLYYSKYQGDLLRLGYLSRDDDYRKNFEAEKSLPCKFDTLNNPSGKYRSHYSVLTIGDSFTERGSESYVNFLAQDTSVSVLQINRKSHDGNPIETLYALLQGDLFDKISFDYLVLQSVERVITERGQKIDKSGKINISDVATFRKKAGENQAAFPPPELLKLPVFSLLYRYNDHAYFSDVYKVKLDKPLFSGIRKDEVLFHKDELTKTVSNNNKKSVERLNSEFCMLTDILKKKNITLIVLPGPDKYDLYYDHFIHREKYPRPNFFSLMKGLKKNYIFIDSKTVLSNELTVQPDIYYFDDTHWSPCAARIIAEEIKKIILPAGPVSFH
jgi:hypothetical protein